MSVGPQGCQVLRKAYQFKLSERSLRTVCEYSSRAQLPESSDWLTDLAHPLPCDPSAGPQIFNQHQVPTDNDSLLRCCLNALTLLEAQIVHHHILKHGFEQNKPLEGLLIKNYTRFGAIKDSLCLFNKSHEHNLDVWNSFITAYTCRTMHSEAFLMFARMQQEAYVPDKVTFMQIVALCARHADLVEGKRVHACIRFTKFDMDVFLGTSIISMYDKCESLKDANRKWHEMPIQNEVSWTAIISCHVHQGRHEEAFHLFVEMQKQGVKPNKVTFVCILDVFASPPALAGGQLTHSFIIESGFESDTKFGIPLISMYKDCGSADDSKFVFEKMANRTTITWNAMISIFVQYHDFEKALELFIQFQKEGFLPDQATFISILGACASPEAVNEGKRMHVRVSGGGFESEVKVGTALINMYGRCSLMEEANLVFSKLRKRDVVSWTSMFAIYSQQAQPQRAIESFHQMLQDGIKPSKVTFVCILDSFSTSMDLSKGNHMHAFIVEEGHEDNCIVGNALLSMYGRFGYLHDARNIFEKLSTRTVVSWTAMIAVHTHHDQPYGSLELYKQMLLNNMRPNLVTFVNILDACAREATIAAGMFVHALAVEYGLESEDSLVNALACMYSKLGSLEDSEAMVNRIAQGEFFWNVKIALHSQQSLYEHSIEFFAQTERRGFKPSVVAYVSVLDACASCAVLEDGELIHFSAINSGCEADTNVATALLNMYGRCGSLEAAWRIFNHMDNQNVIAWSAMIALHGQHGLGQDALLLFEQMQCSSCTPNKVTYCSVLDACNHSGLIFAAWECFISIIQNRTPILDLDHYVSIVDLLGRTGCLDIANFLINNMPHEPITLLYTVMLGACKYHGDVDRAVEIAKFVMELDSENIASYILLSNISASAAHRQDCENSLTAGFVDEQMNEIQVPLCVVGQCGFSGCTKSLE